MYQLLADHLRSPIVVGSASEDLVHQVRPSDISPAVSSAKAWQTVCLLATIAGASQSLRNWVVGNDDVLRALLGTIVREALSLALFALPSRSLMRS